MRRFWVVALGAVVACTFDSSTVGEGGLGGTSTGGMVDASAAPTTAPSASGPGSATTNPPGTTTSTAGGDTTSHADTDPDPTNAATNTGEPEPSTWLYRRRLTVNDADDAVKDLVARVSLDNSRIDFSVMQPGGADLRFFNADITEALPYEIEAWTPAMERAEVWVHMPELSEDANSIWMYYGNDEAPPGADPGATWGGSFTGVWHLNENTDDSTSNAADATNHGTQSIGGIVARARDFGGSEYIELPGGIGGLGNGAVSLWFRAASWANVGMMFYGSTETDQDGYGDARELHINSSLPSFDSHRVQFVVPWPSGGVDEQLQVEGPWDDDAWHYLFASWSSDANGDGTFTLQVDSQSESVDIGPTEGFEFDPVLHLGKPGSDERYFTGRLDEVRLLNARPEDRWIRLDRASVRDMLFTYGMQEAGA